MTTRLIIKNIAKKASESDVRRHFESIGSLTDCQLYSKRCFAYVGFQKEAEALKALQMSGTTLLNRPIEISECEDLKGKTAPKYSNKSNDTEKRVTKDEKKALKKKEKAEKKKQKADEESQEPEKKKANEGVLDDFLKSKVDHTLNEDDEENKEKNTSDSKNHNPTVSVGVSTQSQGKLTPFVVKVKGMAPSVKIREIKEFFAPIPVKNVQILKNGAGLVFFSKETEVIDALRRNRSFIGNKKVFVRRHVVVSEEKGEEQKRKEKSESWRKQDPVDILDDIRDTGRLFIRNLPFKCTESDLQELFSPLGKLTEVYMAYDGILKTGKGFGFVTYMFPEDAVKAYQELDKTIFQGRNLHIMAGQAKPDEDDAGKKGDSKSGGVTSSFQRQKERSLKQTAGASFNWNTLFLSPDAVTSITADQQGVSKSDLVHNKGKEGAAVRLALGETQLVLQTRNFLQEHGVDITALESLATGGGHHSNRRSKDVSEAHLSACTFLVKDLPVGTCEEDLRELMSRWEGLKRVILPPCGVTAIVEFRVPQQAKAAYKATAYSKYREKMLLVQWAPAGLLDESKEALVSPKSNKRPSGTSTEEALLSKRQKKDPTTAEQEKTESTKAHNILIVRNVAFQASVAEVKALFAPFGVVVSVRMPKKPTGDHRGFGFVEFSQTDDAKKALESLGLSTHLYGRRIVIEYADKSAANVVSVTPDTVTS